MSLLAETRFDSSRSFDSQVKHDDDVITVATLIPPMKRDHFACVVDVVDVDIFHQSSISLGVSDGRSVEYVRGKCR
jgi:hypothetical protein